MPAILTSIWCNFQLVSAMATGMKTLERDQREDYWMIQRGRWSGRQQSDDTNQPADGYHKDTVGPERLEDWQDTICSEEVQADWLSE